MHIDRDVAPKGCSRHGRISSAFRLRANSGTPQNGRSPLIVTRRPERTLGVIVPQRHVLNTAIVPERHRVGPPAKPHLEFQPGAVLEQIVQDGAALLFGKPVDIALPAHSSWLPLDCCAPPQPKYRYISTRCGSAPGSSSGALPFVSVLCP